MWYGAVCAGARALDGGAAAGRCSPSLSARATSPVHDHPTRTTQCSPLHAPC